MKYQFNVNISEKDYIDFNKFHMFKSPYGRKLLASFRIILIIFVFIYTFLSLYGRYQAGESFYDSIIGVLPILIITIAMLLLLRPLFSRSIKLILKILKKSGKMGYSPSSVVEFYEENFIEITDENKTEMKYSAIERISIVDNKMIYIHINNVMAFILPISCFESREEYDAFIEFIKTKCPNIDIY